MGPEDYTTPFLAAVCLAAFVLAVILPRVGNGRLVPMADDRSGVLDAAHDDQTPPFEGERFDPSTEPHVLWPTRAIEAAEAERARLLDVISRARVLLIESGRAMDVRAFTPVERAIRGERSTTKVARAIEVLAEASGDGGIHG